MFTYTDVFLFAAIILIFAVVIMLIKKSSAEKIITVASFIAYLAAVICITLFPIIYQQTGYDIDYNFIPFKSIVSSMREHSTTAFLSVFGNIVMFVPFGFYMSLLFKKSNIKAFVSVVAFSLGIELAKHSIGLIIGYRYRCVDIDDVILNTIGGVIGIIAFHLLKAMYVKLKHKRTVAE